MTQTKRIIVNLLATYGRSLVTVFCHLFTARWVLAALGTTDYGLFGVVGSVIFFVTFLNANLAQGVARFYAWTIGKGKTLSEAESKDDLCRWFNTALTIHVAVPTILVAVGYPVCAWALRRYFNIPAERLEACIWVLRISFLSAFIGMASVPYVAWFTAYQFITELVIYSLSQSVLVLLGSYALLLCAGDRLIWYAVLISGASVGFLVIQVIRARYLFSACRIRPCYLFDKRRLREIFVYSGWKAVGGLGWVLRANGSAWLINLIFGPKANASFSVANQLSGQSMSFSANLMGVMTPAITTAAGANDRQLMMQMIFRGCKFGSLLVLLFGVPLLVEMEYFLELWLKTPPPCAALLCRCMILVFLIDYLTQGHQIAICAHGRIGLWQTTDSLLIILTLPMGWLYARLGLGLPSIGYAFLTTVGLMGLNRLYFAYRLLNLSVREWIRKVLCPLAPVALLTGLVAVLVAIGLVPSFLRLCLTTALAGVALVAVAWRFSLDKSERQFVLQRLRRLTGVGQEGEVSK